VLLAAASDDAEAQARLGAFLQALALLGWTIGRNVRIDTRWATANAAEVRKHAAELVALAPDVILAHGAGPVGALQQTTRAVPIVFPIAGDPVGAGLVDSLARPGGNATGFMELEYSIGGKWLELLKEIATQQNRVVGVRNGSSAPRSAQAVHPSAFAVPPIATASSMTWPPSQGANSRPEQVQQTEQAYSITSSAVVSNVGGNTNIGQ
jgi:putative tryptophan/tyrosine transport system substrate-binding protein